MSDELLKRAEREAAFYDKKPTMFTTGMLLRDLAARVRELEAERDDYKAQAKEYWDIGLRRERERDALRALLRDTRDTVYSLDNRDDWAEQIKRIDAALGDRHE